MTTPDDEPTDSPGPTTPDDGDGLGVLSPGDLDGTNDLLVIPEHHMRCRSCRGRGYVKEFVYRNRAVKFDDRAREIFLRVYAICGNIMTAADAAGVAPGSVTRVRDADDDFRELFEESLERFRAGIEEEGLRRAMEGVVEPVYQQGRRVGYKRAYSDQLLGMMLKANIPKYRDRVAIDAKVDVGVLVIPGIITDPKKWIAQYGTMEAIEEHDEASQLALDTAIDVPSSSKEREPALAEPKDPTDG